MVRFLRLFVAPGESLRRRIETLVILLTTSILMLFGVGQRLLDSHNNLADADHLAALSLIMSGVPDGALPVTFLDVDNATRHAWGARDVTPRQGLAELIRLSADKGAAAILVDFDLVAKDDTAVDGVTGDDALKTVLKSYSAEGPLMLARRMAIATTTAGRNPTFNAVATDFDSVVQNNGNIHWVTTLNDVGGDRSVRKIRLWATACSGNDGTVYPSAALVVAAHVEGATGRTADLRTFVADQGDVECGDSVATSRPSWPPRTDSSAVLPYVFADTPGSSALFRIEANGRTTVALRRISARLLLAGLEAIPLDTHAIDKDPFEGRVVIVGASYAGNEDIYETPFGTMPGALILANSAVQAKKIVDTPPVSSLTLNVLTVLLFLMLAVIARTLVGAASVLALCLMTLATLFLVSRWLGFAAGIDVISVAVPGFALFKLVDSLIAIGMNVPKKGWRALLRS